MTDYPPPDPASRFESDVPPPVTGVPSPIAGGLGPDGNIAGGDASMAADRAMLGEPTRQAPLAVVFIAWKFVRNLGAANLAIALFFIISGRLSLALLAGAAVAATIGLVFMILAWWRFVFLVEADELLVRKGVVSQERLTIPLDRVQSVSIDQKLLHRFVDLVSVSVDTAGSSDAELQIDAVNRERAEALQRLVAGNRPVEAGGPGGSEVGPGLDGLVVNAPDGADESVIVRRTPAELVRIGLTAWPWTGLVVLASLFTVADDISGWLPFEIDEDDLLGDQLDIDIGPTFVAYALLFILLMMLAVTVLGAALQIIRELLTNWDMQLIRTSTGLRRTSGLLSRTSKASTVTRIQGVQTDQTPAQRLLGINKLTLPTIGEGDINVPGATTDELARIRTIVFGAVDPMTADRGISRLYIFLAVRNALISTALVVFFAWLALDDWRVIAAFAIVPIRWLEARRRWRLRRWGLSNQLLSEEYEFVNRHTAELDLLKTQRASVSRSFFERRRGLATVRVETAQGYLAVPLIPVDEANAVRDLALYAAESSSKAWM